MSKYDEERLEDDLLAIVQDNLPAKLTEIENEKNDGIVLEDIPSDQYYSTLLNDVLNNDPIIFYGTQSMSIEAITGATARNVMVFFEVLFLEDFSGVDTRKKAFRYIRALREVIEENARKIPSTSGFEIEGTLPTDFVDLDSSNYYKIGGVAITTFIA